MMSTEDPRTESTPSRNEAAPQAIAAASRLGWPMVVRGILGVAFGIVTVFWPRDAINPAQLSLPTEVVDHLAIGYLILFALVLVFQAVRSPLNVRTAIYGQAVIAIPAIVFLFLADHPAELRAALSIWALLHGALEFWAYDSCAPSPWPRTSSSLPESTSCSASSSSSATAWRPCRSSASRVPRPSSPA
ncbi:hypothetical protein [Brevibacterium linens]|uniref:hypothetical protein n=1 Tax=Brevibacterium linens TaxID=1703 RepID=UPI001969FFCA|nr:hypothetical protein [Brevibacterium linens]